MKQDIEIRTRLLSICISNGIYWFRLFGYGLMWKNVNYHSLLFSQRNGYNRSLELGNWYIEILTPKK